MRICQFNEFQLCIPNHRAFGSYIFFRANGVKEDSSLRADYATLQSLEPLLPMAVSANMITEEDATSARLAIKGLDIMQTTATSSLGVVFKMNFGN